METKKSKVFTKKLISMFLAVIMAVSTLFGVAASAYAYQNGSYHDDDIAANALGWVDATPTQTLEALLDTADAFLAEADWEAINKTITALNIPAKIPTIVNSLLNLQLEIDGLPNVYIHAENSLVSANVTISGRIDSVDNIIKLLINLQDQYNNQLLPLLGNSIVKGIIDVSPLTNDLSLYAFGQASDSYFKDSVNSTREQGYRNSSGSYRDLNSAKYIARGVIKWLLVDNRTLINKFLNGTLTIGTMNGNDLVDIYGLIGGLVGLEDWGGSTAWQSDSNGVVYNIVKGLVVNNVPIYSDSKATHLQNEGSNWVYDNELYDIANYYIQKVSFNVTYADYGEYTAEMDIKGDDDKVITGYNGDCSVRRYKQAVLAGEFDKTTGKVNSAYAQAQGWDPDIVYSQEPGYEGNVLVAQYKGNVFELTSADTVYTVVRKALPIIWFTALRPTIELLHVNYNGHDERGTNFDNSFFYYMNKEYTENGEHYKWNRTNYAANYTTEHINAWADYSFENYGFESRNAFLDYVKTTVTYNSTRMAKNEYYNWRDIDSSILFNEIRYSPLADFWGIQTGPLNLYFSQTGANAILDFFDNLLTQQSFATESSFIMKYVDDALVAAMGDLFPASMNDTIGETTLSGNTYGVDTIEFPQLATTSSTAVADIVSTLISDAAKVFEYSANATDANILNPYYTFNNAPVSEDTIEQALIPFAISALHHVDLTASIHNTDWDKVQDIESMAVVALSEYLKYVYPERTATYANLYKTEVNSATVDGKTISYEQITAKPGTKLLDDVIVPMSADALVFVLTAAGAPLFEQTANGALNTSTDIIRPLEYTFVGKGSGINNLFWKTLNGTVCYFAANATTSDYGHSNKCIAALANCADCISTSNDVWTNANNLINKLLPALGGIIGESSIDLKDLLWRDVVLSVADISGSKGYKNDYDQTSDKGFTRFVTVIGNALTCNLLNTETVFNAVIFDIAKPLINVLLGSRSSTAANLIDLTKNTANPADTFLKKANINDVTITNLLNNLVGVLNGTTGTGTANSTINVASERSIAAAAFILNAFQVIPKLKDNVIGGVSATLSEHVFKADASTGNADIETKLEIRNESWGVNDFYTDSNDATVKTGRYYASVGAVTIRNSAGTDVTSNFTVEAADNRFTAPTASANVSLNPEGLIRIRIKRNNCASGFYRVEVPYSMYRTDTYGVSGRDANYSTKAVEFFSVSADASDYAWSDAFTSDHADPNRANDGSGLVTSDTSGYLNIYGPTLLLTGSNAASADQRWYVENTEDMDITYHYDNDAKTNVVDSYDDEKIADVAANYASPVSSATGVQMFMADPDTPFEAATVGDLGDVAFAALSTGGEVLYADDTKKTYDEFLTDALDGESAEAMSLYGRIVDGDGNVTAILVDPSSIGTTYKAGTVFPGVYLDTNSIEVKGNDFVNNQIGTGSHRIISGDSESGLKAKYDDMTVVTNAGSFTLRVATGDIDSNYNTLKSTASGLAIHYYTSTDNKPANVYSTITAAMEKTLSSGVNLLNLDNALDVEEDVDTLLDTAYSNTTAEVTNLYNEIIKARRDKNNIDYVLVNNYEEAVKVAKAAENLVSAEAVTHEETDAEGNTYDAPDYEAGTNDRYALYRYLSFQPAILLNEATRVYSEVYWPQAVKRTSDYALLTGEITHATSSTDQYDELDGTFTNAYTDFDYESDGEYVDFAYSTTDEWDKVKDYTAVYCNNSDVKFGSVDETTGELVNSEVIDGETVKYTDKSWDAYIDALGECVELAQTPQSATNNKTIHAAYDARSHLVIAENNLELEEEGGEVGPVVGEGITISGTVLIATNVTGASYLNKGVPGVTVTGGEVSVTTSDGTDGHDRGYFEITVPAGTTELTVTGTTALARTVSIASGATAIEDAEIPLVIVDYNSDKTVNNLDNAGFVAARKSGNAFADLNGDKTTNNMDNATYISLKKEYMNLKAQGNSTDYVALTIE